MIRIKDEISIEFDPENLEFDLSLLDQTEREFFKSFVGVFDPGPNFKDEDLTLDYD